MVDEMYVNQLEQKIQMLETKVRHLDNELSLSKKEYEEWTERYFDIYRNMEQRIDERTAKVKELQKVLQVKNQELQIMLDSSPGIIFYKDTNKKYLRVNKKFTELFGVTFSEVVGKTTQELFPERQCPFLSEDENVFQAKQTLQNVSTYITTIYGDKPMSFSKIPYKDLNGDVVGIIGFAFDLTDIKKAEKEKKQLKERLNRSEKMEAIGLLAGGVAHDLNNILTGIVSYPDLLLMQIEKESRMRKPLEIIQESGQRAAVIVQDLLTLSRRGVQSAEVDNLNKIIQNYLRSPEHQRLVEYHPNVKLDVKLDDHLLNIKCSHVHITKSIMNLLFNAAEAMPDGGTLKIRTVNKYIDRPVKGYDAVNEGDYSVLVVSDTGIGIAKEDLKRIFEPFYTKKKMGRSGSGLGMAVVWGTVKDHNGYVDVQSVVGKGTTFELYFPVTREEMPVNFNKALFNQFKGNGETILIVDDIREQREIALEMLSQMGYKAHVAPSGEKAVEFLEKEKADLVILDMIMDPGIDGLETFKRILQINPGQKAIIASGYSESDRVKKAQGLGAGAYIKKPYLMERIGMAIREELDK